MNLTRHDFAKPTRLSAAWHHRLNAWWKVALTVGNKTLAKQLPFPLETALVELDVCYARQALTGITENTLVYKIMLGDRLLTLLVMPRTLMLNLVGLLLGDNAAADDREMTLIEEKLGEFFLLNHWLNFFRDTWPGAPSPGWV